MAPPEDRRKIAFRVSVIQYGLTVVFAFIALAFWYLQVVQFNRYYELAENNHQRTVPLRAPRGVLFDRNGRVLVENRDSYNISIVREHTKDLGQTLRRLASVTGVDEAQLQDAVRRHASEPRYRPLPVIEDASLAQVAAVMARSLEFPEVVREKVPTRQYPTDDLAAHLFGYVGEVTEEQLTGQQDMRAGDIVGQSGVEKVYNALLQGEDGAKKVVINSTGREIRTLEEVQATEGRRIELTIDYDVQRATEEGFRILGYNGAAVMMDPRNGEVLSYVSVPSYDPNAFAARGPDFGPMWAGLNTDQLKPLQNRAIQGRYAPGSTFKMAVATAALEEGIATPDFSVHCAGGAFFYGRHFNCWQKKGHGGIAMLRAIEQSCDVYFYTLGNMVGVDRIHKWATMMGLGEKSGIDLPNEVQGIVPSTEWKRATTGQKWYAGETISVAIGQGQVTVTPVSMAVYMSTIANGGTRWVPHLVRAVDEGKGWKPAPPPPPKSQVPFKPETIQTLHEGLWLVVNGAGTGGNARMPGHDVCGKTGTAQVMSLDAAKALAGRKDIDVRDNGWFVFFAPRDNPEIAGVVFAEHSGHGTEAAKIARYALETYFAKKEGRPQPAFPWPPKPAAPAPKPAVPVVAASTPGVPR